MNVKGLLKGALTAFIRVVDSDDDGKVEISDLPGALASIAAMQLQGQALLDAAEAARHAFTGLAKEGKLTSGGIPETAESLTAKYDAAIATLHHGGDESRARLARDGQA